MMARIVIPTTLRNFVDGKDMIEIEANSVGEALRLMAKTYRPISQYIFREDGLLNPYINIYINGINIRQLEDMETVVDLNTKILLLLATAGG